MLMDWTLLSFSGDFEKWTYWCYSFILNGATVVFFKVMLTIAKLHQTSKYVCAAQRMRVWPVVPLPHAVTYFRLCQQTIYSPLFPTRWGKTSIVSWDLTHKRDLYFKSGLWVRLEPLHQACIVSRTHTLTHCVMLSHLVLSVCKTAAK